MSFGQPNSINKADDADVKLPNNKSQVKVIRDKAPDGEGTYLGYLKSGIKELIGGPGSGIKTIYESGDFTLSADGNTFTCSLTSSYNSTTNIATINTKKKLKLSFFLVGLGTRNIGSVPFSDGKSDGVRQGCVFVQVDNSFPTDQALINVSDGLNGWSGVISSIGDNSFDITFTKIGIGLDIMGQFYLEEQ